MNSTTTTAIVAILYLTLAMFVPVACKETGTSEVIVTLPESNAELAEKDLKEINKDYVAADTPEDKITALKKFIELHPNSHLTVTVLDIIAIYKYKEDHLAKANYILENTKGVTNEQAIWEARKSIVLSYAKANSSERFVNYVKEMNADTIPIELNEAVCRGAAMLDILELLGEHGKAMKSKSNVDALRDHPVFGNQEEAGIAWTANKFYELAEVWEAGYLIGIKDYAHAKELLVPQFSKLRTNFVGYANRSFVAMFMARIHFETGDYEAALETIGPLAVFSDNKEARSLYREAFIAAGGKQEGLGDAMEKHRKRIAPVVPNFVTPNLDGELETYYDINGKATLIVLWLPSRGICRTELQKLKPLYERYREKGLEIVTIDVSGDVESVKAFQNTYDLDYVFLKNGQGANEVAGSIFRVADFPTTYLLDESQKVSYALLEFKEGDELAIEAAIQRLLD
ncbi:MAG: redoxin domain-containing protein [Bacteroidota bacterium]